MYASRSVSSTGVADRPMEEVFSSPHPRALATIAANTGHQAPCAMPVTAIDLPMRGKGTAAAEGFRSRWKTGTDKYTTSFGSDSIGGRGTGRTVGPRNTTRSPRMSPKSLMNIDLAVDPE